MIRKAGCFRCYTFGYYQKIKELIELHAPIQAASGAYFCKLSLIKRRDINWRVQVTLGLNKTLIYCSLPNGSEARTLPKQAVNRINFFERRILLNILGPTPGGPGSSVGIATGQGLDGPGIESRWRRDFPHLSRPALGPTQPPVQWVPGLSRGKERPGRDADPSPPSSAVDMKE